MQVKDLQYRDFCELINFIEENFKGTDGEKSKTLLVLRKFLPKLTGIEIVLLMNFIEERTEEQFNDFVKIAGNNVFDETGKSEPIESNFGSMNLDMLDFMVENKLKEDASSASKRRYREIVAAKTLAPLLVIKSDNVYIHKKALYLRQSNAAFRKDELAILEANLMVLNIKYEKLLSKVIDYVSKRSYENGRLFFEHFSTRVSACSMDKNLSDIRNKDYLELLKRISQ